MHRISLLVAALPACLLLGACSTAPEDIPLSAINDSKAHTESRLKAIRRMNDAIAAGEIEAEAGRETLKRTAWARGAWPPLRTAAMEELLEAQAYEADTREMMRLMLPTETSWEVIGFIGDTAAERGWHDLTAVLVRSWSKTTLEPPEEKRPERAALARLYPGRPLEDVVFSVFTGEVKNGDKPLTEREREDAWSLLRRIDASGERTAALLTGSAAAAGDAFGAALRRGAVELSVVPDTGEELAWLMRLNEAGYRDWWSAASSAVGRLAPEQKQGLRLRHVLGVVWAAGSRPQWLGMMREELLGELSSTLAPRRRHVGSSKNTAVTRGAGESLAYWRDKMVWGDVLVVRMAAEITGSPAISRAIFAHADEDRRDTSTELGGVIDGGTQGFSIRKYAPRVNMRIDDQRFITPIEMIEGGSDALFEYHLHCTTEDNGQYAAPSHEDLQYAKRHGRACMVFTFIDRDTINADYYDPNGVVIDLGELKRP